MTDVIDDILSQHAEEAAFLYVLRTHHLHASHIKLRDLARHDERISAHVDGLRVAGADADVVMVRQLENPGPGDLFVNTLFALERKNSQKLSQCLALAEALPEAQAGLFAAFGWVSSQFLQGTIQTLLKSNAPFQLQAAIACCAAHRVHPGTSLETALKSDHASLLIEAIQTVGVLGRRELLPQCEALAKSKDAEIGFHAAFNAAILGSDAVIPLLGELASQPGPHQTKALAILLKRLPMQSAHAILQNLAKHPENARALILGTGISGDPFYIPWLIKQMADEKLARLAGEAFSFITGVDIWQEALEKTAPAAEMGDEENLNHPVIKLSEDENLPWPDPEKISQWWHEKASLFQNGQRYFMGRPLSQPHLVNVLQTGYQRQRIAAAEHLCLLNPGSPLFPCFSPAWRQQRLLAKMV
ncbi:MAG TPA: TIGR02270 family protein [Pseudomonadales bacterium]|nr:TIGR02270 family protein [Pseudomonadales bacterium]